MKVKQIAVIFILIFSLILAGCGKKSSEYELSVTRTSFIMGTLVTVKVYGPDRAKIADEVLAELKRIEELMSINITESEVNEINSNAGVKPVKVSEDTFKVIKLAKEYAEMTNGLFDPSVGPLVQLWGIGTRHKKVPTKEELAEVLPLINYKNIILDEKNQTVYLSRPGMMIDVGGIAKGYAADLAIDIFKKHKVKSGYVNIGGNVMVYGKKPDKSLWRIGIQDPRAPRDDLMAVISLENQAVVTSGDYERYFIENGIRYHHILNPKTGYPARTGLISATVIGDSSFHADALSTSVFLLGPEKGMALAKKMGYEVMVITDDKKVLMSEGIEDKMKIINEEYSKK
ncbi:hypothetical protein BBF96_03890 [Anoxybacter fermentans]|uniref:FAD:protein FMN transferase n=1 Tax=Anoxybacter fermentans TaxID=1323375 RepID=A0A3Q9HP95_9FIRM|nr:FAD:protein FMN transferase [Anoxybacter fermentans]AZR72602.1 hypothetical protein BBF96_03890 [Anoxybacter fermentans]